MRYRTLGPSISRCSFRGRGGEGEGGGGGRGAAIFSSWWTNVKQLTWFLADELRTSKDTRYFGDDDATSISLVGSSFVGRRLTAGKNRKQREKRCVRHTGEEVTESTATLPKRSTEQNDETGDCSSQRWPPLASGKQCKPHSEPSLGTYRWSTSGCSQERMVKRCELCKELCQGFGGQLQSFPSRIRVTSFSFRRPSVSQLFTWQQEKAREASLRSRNFALSHSRHCSGHLSRKFLFEKVSADRRPVDLSNVAKKEVQDESLFGCLKNFEVWSLNWPSRPTATAVQPWTTGIALGSCSLRVLGPLKKKIPPVDQLTSRYTQSLCRALVVKSNLNREVPFSERSASDFGRAGFSTPEEVEPNILFCKPNFLFRFGLINRKKYWPLAASWCPRTLPRSWIFACYSTIIHGIIAGPSWSPPERLAD